MTITAHRRLTGILFMIGAVLVNIPYTLLIMNFNYLTSYESLQGTY